MGAGHCFISYSHADGLDFVTRLANELEGGHPFIPVWFEKREMLAGRDDWDEQLAVAIRQCKCLLYVMSADSTAGHSNCKDEWTWALKYKKPVICLQIDPKAEDQFRLNSRQKIDFAANFDAGLAKLRMAVAHLDSPAGQLEELRHRLADANRDLRRASPADQPRIQADIEDLKKQIEVQEKIAADPKAAEAQTQANIAAGLERERKPQSPITNLQSTKFINPPPGVAQSYFQDRTLETEQVILFLKNDAQRLMTVAGRGGAGKTAMTCRLLKDIENGSLPDDFETKHGKIAVDGIVYLSETGSRKVNFPNLFADLCRLLPADVSSRLDDLYKNPQVSTDAKTHQLLEAFSGFGRVIVLLDNFENVVDAEGQHIADAELDEALKAVLHAPHHPLKFIVTTRVAPRQFELYEPARQRPLPLDSGLAPEFAREALLLMDEGGLVGLKAADPRLLDLAVERTLGLPRALEALYAALRADRYTTLAELLALPVLPENVVAAYVGEAFNRLDTNAQKVMQALAVYRRPVPPAAVDYLLAPHLPAADSAPILQRLVNMHFARRESGKFYLHPVDREFAFGLIPEKDSNTKDTKDSKEEQRKLLQSFFSKRQSPFTNYQLPTSNYHLLFTRHDLVSRAADFFAAARKPRAEWKKLEDLQAQRDEFDLRCEAGDFDTAASVLCDFDFDYLLLWGQYRLMIQMHEKVTGKIKDPNLQMGNLNGLGLAYQSLGNARKSILYFERGIPAAQGAKSKSWEGAFLGNLGNAYAALGDARKAIEFYEQALVIAREIGDRRGEGADLGNLGNAYLLFDEYQKAIEFLTQAAQIADEISYPDLQRESRWGMAQAHLFQNNLVNARTAIESALHYDVPQNNHNASALHGIIALRQGDEVTARGAFVRAIGQADEILSKTAEYYSALDAKGLSLAGLTILDLRFSIGESERNKHLSEAVEALKKARKIAPHAGVVKSVLRLFDELVKCDKDGVLKDVREVIEGKPLVE